MSWCLDEKEVAENLEDFERGCAHGDFLAVQTLGAWAFSALEFEVQTHHPDLAKESK